MLKFKLLLVTLLMGKVAFASQSTPIFTVEDDEPTYQRESMNYSGSRSMRSKRRVAVGASAAGKLGLGGLDLEIDFTPDVGALMSYGGGLGYQAFAIQVRRYLGGGWLSPYIGGGWSRWSSTSHEEMKESHPDYLAEKFLTRGERLSGEFAKNFLTPTAGLQYSQLEGQFTGLAFYLEVTMLVELEDLVGAPTGGLGVQYYF